MVTYAELFQLLLVLIGFAGLMIQISKKEITAPPSKECGYFLTKFFKD